MECVDGSKYTRKRKSDQASLMVYSFRGSVYFSVKDYQQAIADLNRAIERGSKSVDKERTAWFHSFRGNAYLAFKEYQHAVIDFNRAIELNSSTSQFYFDRGMAHLGLKDVGQAKDDFTRSWDLDSTNVKNGWMAEWSEMCQEKDKADSKIADRLETIATVDPDNYSAHVCIGVSSWLRSCFVEASTEMEQAISLEPEIADAHFWKGMVCASLEEYEESLREIETAIATKFLFPPVLLTPLNWLEREKPNFYEKSIAPILSRN